MKKTAVMLLSLLMWAVPALAGSRPDTGAPEELAAWRDWVLYGHEEKYLCPEAAGGDRRSLCAWPISLGLDLNERGGRFTLVLELKTERAFPLPGGPGAWPQAVTDAAGRAVPVGGRERPQVWLPAGRHRLSGSFSWPNLPESLILPAGFVLDLKVDGQSLDFPPLEVDYRAGQTRLWLRKKAEESPEADPALAAVDRLTVNINRLIQDSQPIMIKSRFRLTVSGRPREVLLTEALLPETRATFLSSPLPAQLTPEGLRVRVKPGTYEIFLDSRSLGRSEELGPVPGQAAAAAAEGTTDEPPAAGDQISPLEYWAFQAQTNLRLVEVSGAEQIDPSQADIYPNWRQFPIYVLKPGQSLKFNTLRRGDAEPKPDDLRLARECWLDYDGRGLSCRDNLSGTLSRQWHLNTSPPFSLAQASLAGQPQVITWQLDSKGQPAPGLQMRGEQVRLSADLRIDDFQGILPASGWDHKLETEGQRLNLPPGYRLFHVSGAEALTGSRHSGAGTWTGAWETLDFFLILIISIAVWKLYGRPQGILALVTLIFCYHEALAPRMVFLHLVIAAALLRLLPQQGKARFLVRSWRFLAALFLVILTAFFLIGQARVTLNPQLENPQASYKDSVLGFTLGGSQRSYTYITQDKDMSYDGPQAEEELVMAEPVPTMQNAMNELSQDPESAPSLQTMRAPRERLAAERSSSYLGKAKPAAPPAAKRMVRLSQAPDAKIQNSIPRPGWNWRTVTLHYNTSVTADQEVRLYLQTPTVGRILGLIRIGLMAAFTLVMLSGGQLLRRPRRSEPAEGTPALSAAAKAAVALMLALGLTWASVQPAMAQNSFPDRALLDEYRTRLLKRSPLPETAISEARLQADPEKLSLTLTVEATEETVLALPSLDRDLFRFDRLTLANSDLPLLEDQGRSLTLIPAGRHQLILSGRLKKSAAANGFQINFPNETRPKRVIIEASPAWKAEGLERDGQLLGGGLFLSPANPGLPAAEAGAEEEADQPTSETLSPFFLVSRTLSLGLEWRVLTSVERITPVGAPVSLKLPLLPGEVPITGDLRPDEGRVTLNFGPQVKQLSWESSLPIKPEMTLTAADGAWTESWLLDVSPIWRVASRGLTPIHNVSGGFWQPYFRPWPGESLSLSVDRPEPAPGRYLVIDQARLAVTVGEHNHLNNLNFKLRTSQGGPYGFSLPPGAEVRDFKVDGRSVPLSSGVETLERGGGPTLTASLNAGVHNLEVAWLQDQEIGSMARTPELDLGAPTANLNLALTLPQDRWILWTWGPLQGPAVEFWPLVAVVLLAALALARLTRSPLGWGSWFLLGLGLIQVNVVGTLVVAGWLLALSRRRRSALAGVFRFNAGQILLAGWTLVSLILIYYGIKLGLLQNPDMLISGGGSYGQHLAWFSDRSSGPWPVGGVLSVSVWFYKALMLAWSLWLAVSLLKWLKWGWESFSHEALWKKNPPRQARGPQAPAGPARDNHPKDGDGK